MVMHYFQPGIGDICSDPPGLQVKVEDIDIYNYVPCGRVPFVQVIQPTICVNNSVAPGFHYRQLGQFARRRKRNDRQRTI
jgi:hypothetical protein